MIAVSSPPLALPSLAETLASLATPSSSAPASPTEKAIPLFDPARLDSANAELATATPQEILAWSIDNLPGLYQSTAFGLTGLAAVDMISKLGRKRKAPAHLVPLLFIDTLYHFKETLALTSQIEKKYKVEISVYRPPGTETVAAFEEKYGQELWKSDEDTYDYLVKVEPARRAYAEHNVLAVITGRRQSQGSDRAALQPIEIDSTGLVKVNPLCRWGFEQVKEYIDLFAVPYNALLDEGYKSVGDWHSTKVPVEGESERAGRWSGNVEKTECGLHKDYFKMKKAFEKKRREADLDAADKARDEDLVGETSVNLSLLSL